MLEDIKSLMIDRFGSQWLNSPHNQKGMAEDLTITERDAMRVSRTFGIVGQEVSLTPDNELIICYEVVKPMSSLFDLDSIFYSWWGQRASENLCVIQREIADDEVMYHFLTGTPTHGHSGRVVLIGHEVRKVIQKRWEQRLRKLDSTSVVHSQPDSSLGHSATN